MAAEFREDASRPRYLADLIERARVLVEECFSREEFDMLKVETWSLAPYRWRRRNVHSHGQITPDRVLLVLRTMLSTIQGGGGRAVWIGSDERALAYAIEWTVAYYVADYDYDHIVMVGPQAGTRFRLIALWCQFNMPGDGLDSVGPRPP